LEKSIEAVLMEMGYTRPKGEHQFILGTADITKENTATVIISEAWQ